MTGTIKIATALIAALPLVFSASSSGAQSGYPDHAVKMVVGYPPGGPVDIIGRVMSDRLAEVWGQPVVVEYRPGAGMVVGTDYVAKSPPDGYTIGQVATPHVINPSLYRDVRYVLPFLVQFWMFASPVVYSSNALPQKYQIIYALNPMSGVIDGFRWSLLGTRPPGAMIAVSLCIVLVMLISGVYYFRRSEKSFADVS